MATSKIVTAGGGYTPHPEGQFPAICIDIVDLGWIETSYGIKHKYDIVFYCGQRGPGKEGGDIPYTVRARFTASLNEKASLRTFAESWRGRPFTLEELGKFDLEHMYRAPAYLQIVHNNTETGTYANIKSVMRLPKGMDAPHVPPDYVRVEDRPDWAGPAPQPGMSSAPHTDGPTPDHDDGNDGLPF